MSLTFMATLALQAAPHHHGVGGIVAGQNLVIPVGQVAYLDHSSDIETITIDGTLRCDSTRAPEIVELKVKTIIVNGLLECGTTANPYQKKLIISLKGGTNPPLSDSAHRGIIVNSGGKLILNGDRKNAGWTKLSRTLQPGEFRVQVDLNSTVGSTGARMGQPTHRNLPWSIGDQIVIGPTGFSYEQAEKFTITNITGSAPFEVTLDHPAQYQHWGTTQSIQSVAMGTVLLDERAEVANLTRSILIRADESAGPIDEGTGVGAQVGGHIMVHEQGEARIDSVELYKMGQAGIKGRYPFHWHLAGDVNGQFVKNSSIHSSYQRCITIHGTHKVLVENNVCYQFKGHGFFLEDGNEVENKIVGNLAMFAKAPSSNKLLLASDDINKSENQGRFPSVSAFWISNPKNIVKHNVASGSVGTGFWMSFINEFKDAGGTVLARPIKEATLDFSYNTAHSTKVGITWDGAATGSLNNNPNNPDDRSIQLAHYEPPTIPEYVGLRAHKNWLTGIYFRGQTARFKNAVVADNGWSIWFAYHQIVSNSVIVGTTQNSTPQIIADFVQKNSLNVSRLRRAGVVLYDGPFEVLDSDFIGFSTQVEQATLASGAKVNTTVIPFVSIGATNKFTNVVKGLHFDPEPVHRIHAENSADNSKNRQLLGNGSIRDLDGSLSGKGSNSMIVATRSLGAVNNGIHSCVSGGTSLYNFKICPESYTEGSLTFMRWGGSADPWKTAFLVRRSDGALNYPMAEWSAVPGTSNNLFATPNHQIQNFELLPLYQFEIDRISNVVATLDATSEVDTPNSPVVKIVGYGNRCRLEGGAIPANSLDDLATRTATSYFTNGTDFYVRVIPRNPWSMMTAASGNLAKAFASLPIRHEIKCDPGFLTKRVVGSIEQVDRGRTSTTVSGWACNFSSSPAIQVKLYAHRNSASGSAGLASAKMAKAKSEQAVSYLLLRETTSNQSSDSSVAFKCGHLQAANRSFSFTIPNSELAQYEGYAFAVSGISNTGGDNAYLAGSDLYPVFESNTRSKVSK